MLLFKLDNKIRPINVEVRKFENLELPGCKTNRFEYCVMPHFLPLAVGSNFQILKFPHFHINWPNFVIQIE